MPLTTEQYEDLKEKMNVLITRTNELNGIQLELLDNFKKLSFQFHDSYRTTDEEQPNYKKKNTQKKAIS